MSDLEAPPTTTHDDQLESNSHPVRSRASLLVAAVVIALISGGAGAGLTRLAFGPQVGARGPVGQAGSAGPAGPPGESGSSQVVDTNKLGYCFGSTYQYNNNANWIDSVTLSPPTSNGGTLSCPSGSFISLTPVGPNGNPVKDYDASKTP